MDPLPGKAGRAQCLSHNSKPFFLNWEGCMLSIPLIPAAPSNTPTTQLGILMMLWARWTGATVWPVSFLSPMREGLDEGTLVGKLAGTQQSDLRKRAPFLDFSVTGGCGGKGWEGQRLLSPIGH